MSLIGIIIIIVVPLNTFLLDILLIVNISLSLLILLNVLFINEPLEFSSFPSLLLMTTIFRLALNVSSTRLILGNKGDAGNVIKTFGNFVIGGNPVVGLIIFLIIIVIQFVVITKGSERVAEVAARFTLDAMPGKQMAIDADLNAGLIDEQQARKRREDIQRQADFYGSMDGASKFIKGDAIAGIIITFINLVGGIIIGLVGSSMDFKDVLKIYTLATVGDGLVSQIPALLISTSAGIIATRSAAKGNLNTIIIDQIFSLYKVMFIGGGSLLFMTLIPGLPKIPMIIVSSILLFSGYRLYSDSKTVEQTPEAPVQTEQQEEEEEDISDYIFNDPITVEFGYNLIPVADKSQGGKFLDKVVMIRKQCAMDMGIIVPRVRVKDNPALSPNEYAIKIKGHIVGEGELLTDYFLAIGSDAISGEIAGIETIEPAFGMPALWIKPEDVDTASMMGYTVIDPVSAISTHLAEVIKGHSHELLGRQEVKVLVDALSVKYPALTEDIIPNKVSLGLLQKVLCNLLEENIRIKDLPTIIEVLGDYAVTINDPDELTEIVRRRMKREITEKHIVNNRLEVIYISPDAERRLHDAIHNGADPITPEMTQKLLENILDTYKDTTSKGHRPVILTGAGVRLYVKKLLKQSGIDIDVISTAEIDNGYELKIIGNVSA